MNPTLGYSFIFRDDAATIVDVMLNSFARHFTQIVAVDTGAKDGSRELVDEFLAGWAEASGGTYEVVDFEWCDDFAAARQAGWEKLTTDWAVWADADDLLDGGDELARLAAEAPPQVGAFVLDYDYAQAPNGACVCTLRRERLLRMSVGWKWASPVHEVALPQGPTQYMQVPAPVYRHRKQPKPTEGDRNLRIIERHIAEAEARGDNPDPRMLVYHGVELATRGRHDEAIEAYKRYLATSGWGEEKHQANHRYGDSLRALGVAAQQKGDADAALGFFDAALERESFAMTHAPDHGTADWADHFFGVGETLMLKGHWAAAITWFERGLPLGMPTSSMILNPRDYDYSPLVNLAVCYANTGNHDKALELANQAYQIMPGDPGLAEQMRAMMVAAQRERTVQATIGYLQGLIQYDENLAARRALDYLPYVARNDQRVAQLAHHIRTSVKQVTDDGRVDREAYRRLYATNREVRNPDDFVDNASDFFTRVGLLRSELEAIKKQRPNDELRVLDAGCNDGWVAAHIEHKLGLAVCDGIDLNEEAITAAKDRAERFGLKGRYELGFVESAADVFGEEKYDVIAMFEVFEHLVDPHESVAALERALKPGGRILISTPVGAFEAGLIRDWEQNTAKQHLRAVTPTEFAKFAMRRGVLNAMTTPDARDGVQTVSYTPVERPGRVVLYAGPAWEPWSPLDIDGRGLGGSETALVQTATGLADKGWMVEVFAGLNAAGPIGGVLYRQWVEFDPSERADVFVSSRVPNIADQSPNAARRILWLHDAHCGGALAERIDAWDEVWCLTADHAAAVRSFERLEDAEYDAKFTLTRNGVDLARYAKGNRGFAERQPSVIYSSSPDRGLDQLLRLWPRIRAKAPKATLDVYYGFEVFDRIHAGNPLMLQWKDNLLKQARAAKGVTLHGRVSQADLAAAQVKARVWAYPYAHGNQTETSCITAMEALAAGLGIVSTKTAALPETIGDAGILLPGTPGDAEYDDAFVTAVADLLTDKQHWTRFHHLAKQRSHQYDWSGVVEQWHDAFTTAKQVAV